MDTRDDTFGDASLSPSNASLPDFDFNLPCRFFKSSFARSLSLNNANNNGNNSQCKSLDYDMRCNNNNNNINKLSCLKRDVTAYSSVPPVPPQRSLNKAGSFYQLNEGIITNEHNNKPVYADAAVKSVLNEEEKPPALPARRTMSLQNSALPQNCVNECQLNAEQKYQQNILTQLRLQTYKQVILPVNGNNATNSGYNNKNNTDNSTGLQLSPHQEQQQTLNPKTQSHHFTYASNMNGNNSCNGSSVITNSCKNNIKRNNNNNNNKIVWPNQQKNVEQVHNICTFDRRNEDVVEGDDLSSIYHGTSKLSTTNNYNNHFHNSHEMLHPITSINMHSNRQQQQQHQQTSSHEVLNDNTTNVEAIILQNQVDTLQWQLKQVETSCDMYRAVMEEVARFLERYQSQKQTQQQQQQQQQQHHTTAHIKHYNNNGKLEQIPRSKSLFQVYVAGGHEKSTSSGGNDTTLKPTKNATSSSSSSYLRARSSTNLIDLKQPSLNTSCCPGNNTDNSHIFESSLLPTQSYSAFKDFTWRRSPKTAQSRLNMPKDDVEEKLNQEAFRLLRTIQNLLNTSHHQPDITPHRLSLQMGRLTKARSTTSVMTVAGAPVSNSSSLTTVDANSNDSSNISPTTITTTTATDNNAAAHNLAPEMIFLRSTNMRDSRLSLRSSTDSSVHSTSSAASSASSKVETDEEPTTLFHAPPTTIAAHKQQHHHHHHLAGSSTEDESGFSSISSFPDFGVPLNSTLLSNAHNSGNSCAVGKELKSLKTTEIVDSPSAADSRNSTLKANVVGLPLNTSHDVSHRWDSPSKTYHSPSNKFQKFSALSNDDSNTVLWV